MPELRQNLATKDWVIISRERAQRPHDLLGARRAKKALPAKDKACPFCPGNEAMSEPTVHTLAGPKRWRVRVVRNKFPALIPEPSRVEAPTELYRALPGEGIHEVIIETPSHDKSLAALDHGQVKDVLGVYQERFKAINKAGRMSLILIFKNHGESAGTSLQHPHAQIIGSSVVPAGIRHRMDEAQKYYEQNKSCVFCRMEIEERRLHERVVMDTPHFTAFVPYAALSPFHVWVLPKRHTPSFEGAMPEELDDLAGVLQSILKRIRKGLGDPDYNFVIQSAPLDRGTPECFHWYLSLVVRLGRTAGFELGSGMYINPSVPEESAKFLNSVKI